MTKAEAWDELVKAIESQEDGEMKLIRIMGTYYGLIAKGVEDDVLAVAGCAPGV